MRNNGGQGLWGLKFIGGIKDGTKQKILGVQNNENMIPKLKPPNLKSYLLHKQAEAVGGGMGQIGTLVEGGDGIDAETVYV